MNSATPQSSLPTAPHDAAPLIEQALRSQTPICFQAGGLSMRPCIHDGDRVQIIPLGPSVPRIGSIVLYRRGDKLTLHRIVGRRGREYRTVGDAHATGVDRIPHQDLLGVASHAERDGKKIELNTANARWRGWLWYQLRPLRQIWFQISRA